MRTEQYSEGRLLRMQFFNKIKLLANLTITFILWPDSAISYATPPDHIIITKETYEIPKELLTKHSPSEIFK